jgi:5-methylthioribose kinase
MRIEAATVAGYLVARGLVPRDAELTVEELAGGVSGTVLSVRGPGIALVVKQALPRLRVAEEWLAPPRRTDTEAAALRLAARLIPGRVPPVVDSDAVEHVLVLQHAPAGWRNWQSELLAGRPHAASGRWAGETLGRLHSATAGDAEIAQAFGDYEAFAQLRLDPYHGVVRERLPRLAPALQPLIDELRDARTCLVHGDYAPKNILLGSDGAWVLDAEVAHYGHPVFDLAFFLVFPLLTALERPALAAACSELVQGFTDAYARRAARIAVPALSLAAHTGAMLLARTDGRSPATFLGARAARRARALGQKLLLDPTPDLAAVVASCG